MLAYRIQAAAFGDLDRAILRRLHEHREEAFELRDARPFATRGPTTREGVGLKSGALLVREWNGRLERIMILDDGCAWNGCVYRSLSQVAKAITGTNWNGHRFFGLKAVRTGASNRKRNVTPRPDSLLDIGVSPTLAGFAAAMPDRSPPLATKESNSASPNESADELARPVRRHADDRRELVGKDGGQRRQVTGAVVSHAKEVAIADWPLVTL